MISEDEAREDWQQSFRRWQIMKGIAAKPLEDKMSKCNYCGKIYRDCGLYEQHSYCDVICAKKAYEKGEADRLKKLSAENAVKRREKRRAQAPYVVGWTLVVLASALAAWDRWDQAYDLEIDKREYEHVQTDLTFEPELKPLVERAMADGKITWREYNVIDAEYWRLSKQSWKRRDAERLNEIKRKLTEGK